MRLFATLRVLADRIAWRLDVWTAKREWRRAWRTPYADLGITPHSDTCANCANCVPAGGGRACLFSAFPAMPTDPACARFIPTRVRT